MPAAVKAKPFKTYVAHQGEIAQKWFLVDAADQSLGRLSSAIAMRLMGKDKPTYTAHIDTGDFVVVINAAKLDLHERKLQAKTHRKWSGYPGGLRVDTWAKVHERHPTRLLTESVRRMLPKNLLAKVMLSKLKVYPDDKHPHHAQQPEAWKPVKK